MKMIWKKKLSAVLCLLLTLCTVLGAVPQNGMEVQAADEKEFEIDEYGVLVRYNGEGGNIVIPNEVKSIADFVFANRKNITSVTIPEGVEEIGIAAFDGCSALTSISIPSTVTEIEDSSFCGCTELAHISVAQANKTYYSENNCIIETNTKNLLLGCKTTIIPTDVKSIGDGAFRGSGLTGSFSIPDNVESIGRAAFSGCSNLTSISISKNVKDIGQSAFEDCIGLTSIVIPEGVTTIETTVFSSCTGLTSVVIPESVTVIGASAFFSCTSLTNILIPSKVKDIGPGAFGFCSGLTNVVIPEGVTNIGEEAFLYSGLVIITIPESVTSIGFDAFARCSDKLVIYGKKGSYAETYAKENNNIKFSSGQAPKPGEKIILSNDNVTLTLSQTSYVYDGLSHQPAVTVTYKLDTNPDIFIVLEENEDYTLTYQNIVNVGTAQVIVTGQNNYTGTVTKTFTITEPEQPKPDPQPQPQPQPQPEEPKTLSANNVTLSQTSYAYDGKAKKPAVTVKDGNTLLTAGTDYTVAYQNNKNAGTAKAIVTGKGNYQGTVTKTFTITVKKNTSHKVGSFQYKVTGTSTASLTAIKSSKVTKVKVPKTVKIGGKTFKVTAIGSNAFKKNKKITTVEISDNVKTIGTGAFESCAKLSKVTVGKNVTEIGKNAFKNCKKLGNITIKSTKLKKVGANALRGIKSNAKIKVPAKKLSAYQKLFKNKGQGKKVKIVR